MECHLPQQPVRNSILYLYLVCSILSMTGAWLTVRFAFKFGFLDSPNKRSSHVTPTPKGGGIGILAAFILASLVLKIPADFWLSATLLSLISLYGDRIELAPRLRLFFQFIAAFILTYSLPLCSRNPFLCTLLSLVFIVGTANFYNFMDGINGIASITGVVGFGLLALYAFFSQPDYSLLNLALCISFSCLGFLPFNIPGAKVFMGDVGSILLGFVYAGMVLVLSENLSDFITLSAFLFPFYADELITMAVRAGKGENLSKPHRSHIYQMLANEYKIRHWKVSAGYGLVQMLVGISILLIKDFGTAVVISVLAAYFCGVIAVSCTLRRNLLRADRR